MSRQHHTRRLTDLENAAGMALPSVGTLTAIGAFRLDLGARDSVLPVQLRIPLQLTTRPDGTPLQEGDEVVFCRRGSFVDGNVGGVTVEIHYTMSVDVGQPTWVEGEYGEKFPDPSRCPLGEIWKISSSGEFQQINEPVAQSWLNPDHSNITITFTDISGQSLGITTHTGDTTQITLDTDAAGYGWHIDPLLLDS